MTLSLLEGHSITCAKIKRDATKSHKCQGLQPEYVKNDGARQLTGCPRQPVRFQERQEAYLSSGFCGLLWCGLMRLGLSLQFKKFTFMLLGFSYIIDMKVELVGGEGIPMETNM